MAVIKKINKKERTLTAFFLRFLLQVILSVIVTGILWLALILLGIKFHITLPANYAEQNVRVFADSLTMQDVITPDRIPEGADYAIYGKDRLLRETNLSAPYLEQADSIVSAEQKLYPADFSGRVYLKLETDSQILVLTYRIRSVFTNPVLRHLLPDIEVIGLVVFLFLLIINLTYVIIKNAKRLSKELLILQHATNQIREQNLDFEMTKTGIREFNQVADSLDALRTELSLSLKKQWHMQQQQKRQLSALAHDIKTPLTIVRGNAELLAETALDTEQDSYNRFILKNTGQIQNYITKMIELVKEDTLDISSEIPNAKNVMDFAVPVPFRQFLDELCENTKSLGHKKDLSIFFIPETLPEYLPFPEDFIKRILNNLLDNAIYYSPRHGTVTLHARVISHNSNVSEDVSDVRILQFIVSDEGNGFSAEALRLGTEEFYRADAGRSDHTHFGLGLAIVRQLADEVDGTLTLGNRPERGGIVTVELPL